MFGRELMSAALERILRVLLDWGYKPSIQGKMRTALAYTLLTNRSPRLEDLTLELLTSINQKAQTKYSLTHLYAIRHFTGTGSSQHYRGSLAPRSR